MNILQIKTSGGLFDFSKYGYRLDRVLNNQNRWDTKIVCAVFDKDLRHCVSTTYAKEHDYLKFVELTTFLGCQGRFSPKIIALYPQERTAICGYVGTFLQDYLLENPQKIELVMSKIFDYLRDLNEINRSRRRFVIPSIVSALLELSKDLDSELAFMPKSRQVLAQLCDSGVTLNYGYGIEDPHIWNFRISEFPAAIQAFTTDFDYLSDAQNCFWEMGYLYATFRWLREKAISETKTAEESILCLVQGKGPESEFMFWLGALSSYCGYKDSLRSFMKRESLHELETKYTIINTLDEKVASLAENLQAKTGRSSSDQKHK
ncbi:hypothetical protein ACFL3N_01520 [Candidatus Omnitrophota bacterium]